MLKLQIDSPIGPFVATLLSGNCDIERIAVNIAAKTICGNIPTGLILGLGKSAQ